MGIGNNIIEMFLGDCGRFMKILCTFFRVGYERLKERRKLGTKPILEVRLDFYMGFNKDSI